MFFLQRRFSANSPRALICSLVVATLSLIAPQIASAQIRIATGLPESSTHWVDPINRFAERLNKDGIGTRVQGLELLSLAEMASGVRDGLADAGFVLIPYSPSEFSASNLAADLGINTSQRLYSAWQAFPQ